MWRLSKTNPDKSSAGPILLGRINSKFGDGRVADGDLSASFQADQLTDACVRQPSSFGKE